MIRTIDDALYQTLSEKAFMYDATIAPVIEKYNTQVNVLTTIVIILAVSLIVSIFFYQIKKKECKFYKDALNVNFSWWK
jgi:multisubunit Na+/H+ antiporter MnhC subunit